MFEPTCYFGKNLNPAGSLYLIFSLVVFKIFYFNMIVILNIDQIE